MMTRPPDEEPARPRTPWVPLLVLCLLLALAAGAAHAVPFTPVGDDEVVATLPSRFGPAGRSNPAEASRRERSDRALRAALRRDPNNLTLALLAARQHIDSARRDGDPRELGQAQAALAPWWSRTDAPPQVRLLRAIVLQAGHAFDAAQADLDALLAPSAAAHVPPDLQAQALLTRASIQQVRGRYAEAAQDCATLGQRFAALGLAAQLPARACAADLAGLQGRGDAAQAQLDQLAQAAPPGYAGWLALMQGELAERRADLRAEALYRQALADQSDVYTLAALADWLIDHGRAREVTTLLAGREDADALLLRLAIAYKATGDARAPQARATLRARFDDAAARGDTTHGRERARFALAVEGQPPVALSWAQQNWAVQKEPADARLLVEAAYAAGQPAAAEPVRRFMRDTGFNDARLSFRSPA
jgi:hypothetical protein